MKRRSAGFIIISLAIATLCPRAWCQEKADPAVLTLERIFSSGEFSPERFGPARWMKDGKSYTTVEDSAVIKDGRDIVIYSAETGKREILIPATRLIPSGETKPLRIDDYQWSAGGKRMLLFTNSQRVWRQNTRGDYWVLDPAAGTLQKLGTGLEPESLMFAKFSPQGDRIAYVFKNNIYVEDLASGKITPLTKDGSGTLINGTFDWVYEEEFGLRDGFRWSPDGSAIAFWQLDSSGVKEFQMINNTDGLYPRVITFKYPKVGEANSSCRVGVVSSSGGEVRWFQVPGDPSNNYIARMEWTTNPREIILQHLNRLQNKNEVMIGDAASGDVRTLFTDNDECWVEVCDSVQWLDKGQRFTWLSERDGWNHVYVVSREGDVRLVTPGDFDVLSVEAVDEKGGWLYFIASPDNPTQRYLWRRRLDGQGQPERVTPVTQPGTHSYDISPTAQWAFHIYSAFGVPPVTELVRLPKHSTVRTLADNDELRAKVDALKKASGEFFRIDIGDGVELDGWCLKPPGFDPQKSYPLLIYVYGEPAGQTVLDRWDGNRYVWHLMLTQQGYIVASIDNRGTPAARGRAWRKSIYREIGILASADQAAAVKALLRKWPYVDPARVGVWGWSGGGSMTLNAMFRYPDLYKTGIAIAFVSDQRLYDTIYQERYMDLPKDNEEGFKNGSPITFASQLKGNLLIIHGTGDDNVHYQSFEKLVNELVANRKRFTMMAYPNRSHGIYEGENTTMHLYELMTRYLQENLLQPSKD
ncbi:MAG TPA: S9 family peptidase [Candidatus Desulfaltia sp.]|nr:S9 family peptidase [Candidatus Desulfaltia sp.]